MFPVPISRLGNDDMDDGDSVTCENCGGEDENGGNRCDSCEGLFCNECAPEDKHGCWTQPDDDSPPEARK